MFSRYLAARIIRAAIILITLLGGGAICAAQPFGEVPNAYRIKPSDVVVPEGVPLGQYSRTFRPFENWTLICDENYSARQMVCNVTQSVLDTKGTVVFSWSLAATSGGQPFLLMRALPNADTNAGLEIRVSGAPGAVKVAFDGCNQTVCLGKANVGAAIGSLIDKEADVMVSYKLKSGETQMMRLPFKGLKDAVAAIGSGSAASPAAKGKDAAKRAASPATKDKSKLAAPPTTKDRKNDG